MIPSRSLTRWCSIASSACAARSGGAEPTMRSVVSVNTGGAPDGNALPVGFLRKNLTHPERNAAVAELGAGASVEALLRAALRTLSKA